MIEKNRYRLGEYQITEYQGGVLWWSAHHGFAEQRSGRCFIYEDILMFGQFSNKEDGFLKREFLRRLRELPIWNKTKFYCFLSDLLEVSSGRSLDRAWGSGIPPILSGKRDRAQDAQYESPGTFRLDKYIITVAGAEEVSWRALEGMDRVVGGRCMIHSGILFIGPKDYEAEREGGRELSNELEETAPWKRTDIWSQGLVLCPCESSPQTRQPYNIGEKVRWRGRKYPEKTVTTFWKGYQEAFKFKSLFPPRMKFKEPLSGQPRLPAGFKSQKPSWPFHLPGKARIFELSLLLVRRVIGLMLSLYSWTRDYIATTPLRRIIVNRTVAKSRYKRIMEAFMSLKRYLLPALILIMQAGGIFDVTLVNGDDFDRRHRNRYRERHRDDDARGRCQLKAVADPIYRENCGGCHFAYQPELLPSASWVKILDSPDNHFGESFEFDEETKEAMLGYLQTNAADHSSAKRAVKIMRSLDGQVPTRITEIPYIKRKHHEISAAIVKRRSIGSLSNCTACHGRAQEGIYDDDFVAIPEQ
jgi:hypothetical protein